MIFLEIIKIGRIAVFGILIYFVFSQSSMASSKGQEVLDLGIKFYREGLYQDAAKAFKDATQLNPGLLKAWKNLGRTYYRLGRTKEALEVWQTLLKIEPGDRRTLNSVGFFYIAKNQWRLAIPHLKKSLKTNPDQDLVRFRLGIAYKRIGKYNRAIGLLENAYKAQPGNQSVLVQLADTYAMSDQWGRAISIYKNYLKGRSNVAMGEEENEIAERLSNLLEGQGEDQFKNSEFKSAENFYQQALSWRPNHKRLLLNLGWAQEKQGKYNEAIRVWLKIVDQGYTGFQLFHQIANAYYHSGQMGKAQIWYQNASGINPVNNFIQSRLFELAMQKKEIPNALTELENMFVDNNADKKWSLRVANHFIRNGHLEKGVEYFLNRLPQSSDPRQTKQVLGKLFANMGIRHQIAGNTREAISNFENALSYESNMAAIYRDLGWLYWREGRQDLSEKKWNAYRNKFPEEAEPHDLLARLYLFQGSYEKSLKAVKKSLKIKPGQLDQKLLQVKALLGGKRYAEAMNKSELLAQEYSEHLPVQFVFGEALMLYQNFEGGIGQWRKVLDMGSKSPRANYYWIKSLYETGKYNKAVMEARKYLTNNEPYEQILKLVRDDADYRGNHQEIIYWNEKILDEFPERSSQWLKMAKLYVDENELNRAHSILDEAKKIFPDNIEVQLAIGELEIKRKNFQQAMRIFEKIRPKYPENRRAFLGFLSSLVMLNEYPSALKHLKLNKSVFLKNYEIEMTAGNILNAMGKNAQSNSRYLRVINSTKQEVYFPILLYHGLSTHPRSPNQWNFHFEEQLKALKNSGYQTITVTELKRIKAGKMDMPLKPILLTFDDARIDAFRLGDPVLKKYGMKATMFVPADRANHEHPFFASWRMIQKYSSTGRWDVQAHGDQAHDLIPINHPGEKGFFLVNLMWDSEGKKMEKDNDYYKRLKHDYSKSIITIEREIPGARVSGYAYPFSEAGQTSRGNTNFAQRVNETLLNEFFQFGFIQDLTGYNRIRLGDDKTSLLRRFSVPRNWNGDRLIQHLAETHPAHVAQLALAKSYYWNGQYSDAEKMFSDLVAQEPRFKKKVQFYLADISFQGGHYWESDKLLQEIPRDESNINSKIKKLEEAIAWKNRPRVFGGFDFFHDSNDRTNHSESAQIYFPMKFSLELMLGGALVNFEEKGRRNLDGNEVTAGMKWGAWKSVMIDGKFRHRNMSQKRRSQSYWASAQYSRKQNEVQFNWSERDVDTVQAIENRIQVQSYSLGYQRRFSPHFLGKGGLAYQDYEDGNTAFDITTRLRYSFPELKNWKIGGDVSYKDSDFKSPAYYTPDQLLIGVARVFFYRQFGKKYDLRVNYGVGGASDKVNGIRWVTKGGVNLDYRLTRQLKAGLATKFSVVPSYNSMDFKAFIGYHF